MGVYEIIYPRVNPRTYKEEWGVGGGGGIGGELPHSVFLQFFPDESSPTLAVAVHISLKARLHMRFLM